MKDIGLDIPGLGVELLDLPQRLGPQLLPRDTRFQQDATAIRAVDALLVSPVVLHRVRDPDLRPRFRSEPGYVLHDPADIVDDEIELHLPPHDLVRAEKGQGHALADHGVADTACESRRAEGASLQEIELEDLPEGGIRIRDVTRPVLKPVHGRGGQRPVAIHIDGGNGLRPFQRIAALLHQGQSQRRVGDAPVIILAIAHDGRYVAGAATVYLRLETRRIHDIQDDDHHDHANGQGGTEYRDHAQQLVLPDHPQRLFNVLLYHKPLYYKLSITRPKQRLFVIIRLCAPTEANNVPKT